MRTPSRSERLAPRAASKFWRTETGCFRPRQKPSQSLHHSRGLCRWAWSLCPFHVGHLIKPTSILPLSLYAALEVQTGKDHGKTAARHTSDEFVGFLRSYGIDSSQTRDPHRLDNCCLLSITGI